MTKQVYYDITNLKIYQKRKDKKWQKNRQQYLFAMNVVMNPQNGLESVLHVGQWNTFFEEKIVSGSGSSKEKNKPKSEVIKLNQVEKKTTIRIETGVKELDRVLGGGFVKGSLTLLRW